MRLLAINAGFGETLGDRWLGEFETTGFNAIRQAIPDNHERAWAVIRELQKWKARIFPIVLLGGGKLERADGYPWTEESLRKHVRDVIHKLRGVGFRAGEFAVEIGNEPDIAHQYWSTNPLRMAQMFGELYGVLREEFPETPILSPSISNLNQRGISYLNAMARFGFPPGCEIAIHRYPPSTQQLDPHEGFEHREDEVDMVRLVAGDRRIWVTETGRGAHFETRSLFGLCEKSHWMDQTDAADFLTAEVRFWKRVGAHCCVVYQHRDAPGVRAKESTDAFGVWDEDGNPKVFAGRVVGLREEMVAA